MKIKEIIKKNLKWIVVFICLVYFLEITYDVFKKQIMKKDIIGYELISKYVISDFATPIAIFITQFGSATILLVLATILFFAIENKRIGFCIYLNLLLTGVLNQVLKFIIQRPRPDEFRMIYEGGYSFPSGHSMASTAFYGFLIYLIYKKMKNRKLKIFAMVFLSLLIASIGISRIYLGVHYTSDVLAGFLLSVSYLTIYTNTINNFIDTNQNKNIDTP